MLIRQFTPPDSLNNLVDYIWVVQSDFLSSEEREDIIMPLGHMNVIFNYASEYSLIERDEERLVPNAAMIGQIKSAKHVRYGETINQMGISLKPAGFISRFHMQGIEITEQVFEVKNLDPTVEDLYCELKDIKGIEAKIARIYNDLEDKMVPDRTSRRIEKMTAYIEDACESLNIARMAEAFFISVSALERFFKKNVGLTPKSYGEIIKFRKNVENDVRRRNLQNFYYDQSHLMKNTRRLSGKTAHELETVKNELTLHHVLNSGKESEYSQQNLPKLKH